MNIEYLYEKTSNNNIEMEPYYIFKMHIHNHFSIVRF